MSSFSAASGSRRSRSPVTFPGTRARPESYSLSVRIKVRRIRWCCTPGVRQSRRYDIRFDCTTPRPLFEFETENFVLLLLTSLTLSYSLNIKQLLVDTFEVEDLADWGEVVGARVSIHGLTGHTMTHGGCGRYEIEQDEDVQFHHDGPFEFTLFANNPADEVSVKERNANVTKLTPKSKKTSASKNRNGKTILTNTPRKKPP